MVTYLNEYCVREEVKDAEAIATYYAVEKVVNALDEDAFMHVITVVGDYVWEGGRANANKARALAKKLGFSLADMAVWYCLED